MRIEPEHVRAMVKQLREWGYEIHSLAEEDLVDEFDVKEESNITVTQARENLRRNVISGTICPVCDQHAKVYRRKVNSTMARTAITILRHGGSEKFVHTPSLPGDTHEASQLSWWGFLQEEDERRSDGGRAGYWMLTPKGESWVRGKISVPKYAVIYDSECLRLEGDQLTIEAALGNRFNYRELMQGV